MEGICGHGESARVRTLRHVAVAAAGKITVTAGAQKKRPRSARKMKDDPKSAESSGKVWYPSYEHMKCNT
jgi:predicted transcriptional regulator